MTALAIAAAIGLVFVVLLSLAMSEAPPPPKATVFLQDACYKHQYIRSTKDLSQIVERPERIRAVKVGLAAALSRIESQSTSTSTSKSDPDDLVAALDRLALDKTDPPPISKDLDAVAVIRSSASLDLLHHPAVKFVHGDVDGDVHAPRLKTLADQSYDKIATGESEIPQGLSQGDLYRIFLPSVPPVRDSQSPF